MPLADHPALAGLDPEAVRPVPGGAGAAPVPARRRARPPGEPAEELFLVTGGRLSVWVPVGGGDARRLATLEAGGIVGELAFLGRDQRTADVYADTEVEA